MGLFGRLALLLTAIVIGITYQKFRDATRSFPVPNVDLNQYWGPGASNQYQEDKTIKRQEIFYEDASINALRDKLNQSLTLHNPLEGMTHEYGISAFTVIDFVDYWRDEYMPKWSKRQELLNTVPHFQTQIQGLRIHFIHIKPSKVKGTIVIPMLLLHGWPGSVREFYDFFPLLTTPNDNSNYVFEVIAPSLPGFGWSEASAKPGFGPVEISVVLRNLMIRLGHERFMVQGGDWGSLIGSNIATLFPENVIGYHSNYCTMRSTLSIMKGAVASFYPSAFIDKEYESFIFPIMEKYKFLLIESGYFHIHATKPDTIGIALTKNPVGLAAYILEKVITLYPDYNIDAILDNIMIYYLTNSATTSARIYAEAMTKSQLSYEMNRVETNVPTACARFVNDIMHCLDWQLTDKYTNLVQSTYHKTGGHFAALEVPLSLIHI